MALRIKNFATLVQNQAAAIQGRAANLIDFSVGSVLRAIIESNASLALWLQGEALRILLTTRAATSTGADLDTFVGDYGLVRLGAQASIGIVTFSRFTPGAQALIPVGALVATADASTRFSVVLDASNPTYNAGLGGYVLPVGVSSLDVPVQALQVGSTGNVLPNTITAMQTSILYVDTVTNAGEFRGGGEEESDADLRTRFVAFINSLSKATRDAITFAIMSVRLGLQSTIVENQNRDGSWRPGYFCVTINDGTGEPSDLLLTNAYSAIDRIRAATVMFGVFPPTVIEADVSLNLVIRQGYSETVVKAQVGTAIRKYLDALYLGESLPYTKIAQLAYEASPGVENVYAIQLNNRREVDLMVTPFDVIKAGIITVS